MSASFSPRYPSVAEAGRPDLPICFVLAGRDRIRTAVNVLADSMGVAVVQHLCRKEILTSRPTEECSAQRNHQLVPEQQHQHSQ